MSNEEPDLPEIPPPPSEQGNPTPGGSGRAQEPRGGSIGVGVVFGALALYFVYVGGTIGRGPYAWSGTFLAVPVPFIPIAVYLALAITLAVRRATARLGAGLLIGLGIFTLLGGGLCIGALVQSGV